MHLLTTVAALSLSATAFAVNITLYSDTRCSEKIQVIDLDVPQDGPVAFNVNTSKPIFSIGNYVTYPSVAYACWDVDCKNGSVGSGSDGLGPCIEGWDEQDNKTVALVATGIGSF